MRTTKTLDETGMVALRRVAVSLPDIAVRALKRMYLPKERLFAFRVRRDGSALAIEGTSHRYTAIALIGLANESDEVVSSILGEQTKHDVCDRLLFDIDQANDLGEVALAVWAARVINHFNVVKAVDRLRAMQPTSGEFPTVELSWALTALVTAGSDVTDHFLARSIAERLVKSFRTDSDLFPHWPDGARTPSFRSHVTCFADMVYPIQALSHFHLSTGGDEVLDVVRRCGRKMCELQGPQGQWWWHFDVRTGRVVERYPVYAVHQYAMAPMAIFALQEATGDDYRESVIRSLQWLIDPPEIPDSLIDEQADVIWRKVARHEPNKLVRRMQAVASRLHPTFRFPGMDIAFRPGQIDYESRPYCMGWILYAWPIDRISRVFGEKPV